MMLSGRILVAEPGSAADLRLQEPALCFFEHGSFQSGAENPLFARPGPKLELLLYIHRAKIPYRESATKIKHYHRDEAIYLQD
jgi:hypothetical protein